MSHLIRNKKLININKAASVGIVFELNNEEIYQALQEFMSDLQKHNTRVKALGFATETKTIDKFLPVMAFDLFSPRQLNWFYIPKSTNVKDFISTDFDICINLAPDSLFPLKYVTGMSKAKLKVGAYSKNGEEDKFGDLSKIYDIMLLSDENHNQINFLKNSYEYLTILNPK